MIKWQPREGSADLMIPDEIADNGDLQTFGQAYKALVAKLRE